MSLGALQWRCGDVLAHAADSRARSLYTQPLSPWDLERCRRQLMVQYGCCCLPACRMPLHSTDGAATSDEQCGDAGGLRGGWASVMDSVSSVAINVSTCVTSRPSALQPVTAQCPPSSSDRAIYASYQCTKYVDMAVSGDCSCLHSTALIYTLTTTYSSHLNHAIWYTQLPIYRINAWL